MNSRIILYFDSLVTTYKFYSSADTDNNEEDSENNKQVLVDKAFSTNQIPGQVLCIQMEFCERKTLRTIIDNRELVRSISSIDYPRICKFLREIVEGSSFLCFTSY